MRAVGLIARHTTISTFFPEHGRPDNTSRGLISHLDVSQQLVDSMPVTNRILNASKEENCFAITAERKYYHVDRTFIKRSLRPSEWQVSFQGTIHVPRLGRERLFNEAASIKYIRENTNIPVPTLYACFEDDNAAYLVTSYVDGFYEFAY